MKVLYCINSTYNSGGMERVLMNKANYFADKLGYEVYIVTAEQNARENFFPFSSKIKFIDLSVNYYQVNGYNRFIRFFLKYLKSRTHQKRLTKVLQQECPQICISMFDKEFPFLCKIKDGSKKVLEYHFSKYTKLYEAPNWLIYRLQQIRIWRWEKIIQQYDSFVVLTEEDKKAWGNLNNIVTIPNSIPSIPAQQSTLIQKQVCSIGRISYQKGFDILVQVWQIVHRQFPDWHLCIVGSGDVHDLQELITNLGVSESVSVLPSTPNIDRIYLNSSVYAMTSRYEGFGMVLIEAMSYGLPIVAFSCPCGPKDIVEESFGTLIPPGNIYEFAKQLMSWMANEEKRKSAGIKAKESAQRFLESEIMKKWQNLFSSLVQNV